MVMLTVVNIVLRLCAPSTAAGVAVFNRALHSGRLVVQPMATTENIYLLTVSMTIWKSLGGKNIVSIFLPRIDFHVLMLTVVQAIV